mgnify:CR=1 FL=1
MNLKYIFTLLNSKKKFRFPKKNDVLLYDDHGIDLMKILFSKNDFSILNTRKEIIHLPILIICLLNFKFKLDDYFFYFIRYVDPKIIVTHNDNYISFYNLARRFKNKKFIAIQRSVRSYHNDIYSSFKNNFKINGTTKFSIEKFFIYNKQTQKEFNKYVDADFEVIGSAIANNNKSKIKTNEVISWVSNYVRTTNDKSIFYAGTDDVLKEDIKLKSIKLVEVINNFCKSRKLKFNILAKMNTLVDGPELVTQEKKFYEKFLSNEHFNLIENKHRDNFRELDRSAIVIGSVSNLLYESIFRGNKTFFLNLYPDHKILNTKRFGYLSGYPSIGPFWANSTSSSIEESLDKILKMTKDQWENTINTYNPELIYFDENNSKLKDYFKSEGF